jgi:hypothetical protein
VLRPLHALQDDLTIYDRVLTADQTYWLYNDGNLLYNGDWEAPNIGSNQWITNTMGSEPAALKWSLTVGTVDNVRSYWLPYAGWQSLDTAGTSMGAVRQTVTGLAPGQIYTFSTMMSGNFDAAGYRGLAALLNGVVIGRWTMDPPAGWVKATSMGYQRKEFTFVAAAATATLDLQCMFDNTYAGAVVDSMRFGLVRPTPLPTPTPFSCPNGALTTYTNVTDPPIVSADGRISNYSVGGVSGLEAQLVPSLARYVRFWKTPSEYDASTIYINIAEVAVYAAGDTATNVALNKGVASSSVYAHPFYAPAQMTDGITTTTYSNGAHTDDANPWVEVDLQQNTPIALIVMWPRPDAASRSFNMNVQLLADGTRAVVASFKLPSSFNPSPPRAMYQAQVCASPSPSQTASSTATSSVTGSLTASSSLTPSASQVSGSG